MCYCKERIVFMSNGTKITFQLYSGREVELNEQEGILAALVVDSLEKSGIDKDLIHVVRKSDSYTTIVVRHDDHDQDLMRFKFTPRAKWVSVPIIDKNRQQYINDAMFSAQKNKRQGMWKARIENPADAVEFVPIMLDAYEHAKSLI